MDSLLPLREAVAKLNRPFQIGTCVRPALLRDEADYAATVAAQFNTVTPGNEMKFCRTQPTQGQYDFRDADMLMDWAPAHNLAVRGHTLCWHECVPDWLNVLECSRADALAMLQRHIGALAGRYRGHITIWDVVNEAIEEDGTRRANSPWQRLIGDDYLDTAFHLTHATDPTARLYYNDFDADGMGGKADQVYELVAGLVKRGVPIHGVGLQMHIALDKRPTQAELAANMARLTALGLDVQITEMDVRVRHMPGTWEERFAQQAVVYREALEVCLDQPRCVGFLSWGFTDKHSWLTKRFGDDEAGLFLDATYAPKPAFHAMHAALAQAAPAV